MPEFYIIIARKIFFYEGTPPPSPTCLWGVVARRRCSLSLSVGCMSSVRVRFYRAMHFSAKRRLAIACRPSVTLVDCEL